MEEQKNSKLVKKFEIMKFFDDARRSGTGNFANYGSGANLCAKAQKVVNGKSYGKDFEILVHWITYIAERGSDFRRIWDVGGYVYSNYLADWKEDNKDLASMFKPGGKYLKKSGESYRWVVDREDNKRLEKYTFDNEKEVEYISRYCVADYFNMSFTLYVLQDEKYGKSLLNFLKEICSNISKDDQEKRVKGVAMALYLLTYYDFNGDLNKSDVDNDKFKGLSILNENKNKDTVATKLENSYKYLFESSLKLKERKEIVEKRLFEEFDDTYERFFGKKLSHQFVSMKRVWCALRDYIKDKKYNQTFFKEVFGVDNLTDEIIEKYAYYLELPGDVWNNNSTFLKCVFDGEFEKEDIKKEYGQKFGKNDLNKYEAKKLLRLLCDNNHFEKNNLYHEIFDCTFNFAPRMCDANGDMCSVCPFGVLSEEKDSGKGANFDDLCVCVKGKLCPVALVCCGYQYECQGDNCRLLNIKKELDKNK